MTTTLDDDDLFLYLNDDDNADDLVFDPAIFDDRTSTFSGTPSPIYSSPSPEIEPPILIPEPIQPRKSPKKSQKQQPRRGEAVFEPEEIEDLNNLLRNDNNTRKKSPNYKIGYEKRKNNKIYVNDIEKYEKIYEKTSSDVFPVYKMLYNNEIPLPLDGNNISEKYRDKITKDYEDNRGNCQTQTKENQFQTDEKGKYIYSDQILRSHSFNAEKGSQARKCFLELDDTSTRLLKREKEIFGNEKLFILENGDDYELKLWYEERNSEMDYQNLKKEWNDWKKRNENIFSKFKINSRQFLQVLDKEYKNFDDFFKDRSGDDDVEKFRMKIKELYKKDLIFFLRSNNLKINHEENLVSRYDLKRKLKKKEDGKIVIYDSQYEYFSIPAEIKKQIKKKCSKNYQQKRKDKLNCEEQLSKKFDLIKYSKSAKKSRKK